MRILTGFILLAIFFTVETIFLLHVLGVNYAAAATINTILGLVFGYFLRPLTRFLD